MSFSSPENPIISAARTYATIQGEQHTDPATKDKTHFFAFQEHLIVSARELAGTIENLDKAGQEEATSTLLEIGERLKMLVPNKQQLIALLCYPGATKAVEIIFQEDLEKPEIAAAVNLLKL